MKTLTVRGLEKIAEMFGASLSHAIYEHNGHDEHIPILSVTQSGSGLRVYVYFDAGVTGSIGMVRLVDFGGDVVAACDREFIKQDGKGFYAAFKYSFVEVEDDGG